MDMNPNQTFYVIHSPHIVKMQALDFGWDISNMPDYMRKGYFISADPVEPWNIKFSGTFFQCRNVLISINSFVYN